MIKLRNFTSGPWRAVPVLGVTQILSWGTIFYTPVLIVPLIAADRGWSISFAMGGFSVGLLVAGLVAPYVGRSRQVRRARRHDDRLTDRSAWANHVCPNNQCDSFCGRVPEKRIGRCSFNTNKNSDQCGRRRAKVIIHCRNVGPDLGGRGLGTGEIGAALSWGSESGPNFHTYFSASEYLVGVELYQIIRMYKCRCAERQR